MTRADGADRGVVDKAMGADMDEGDGVIDSLASDAGEDDSEAEEYDKELDGNEEAVNDETDKEVDDPGNEDASGAEKDEEDEKDADGEDERVVALNTEVVEEDITADSGAAVAEYEANAAAAAATAAAEGNC